MADVISLASARQRKRAHESAAATVTREVRPLEIRDLYVEGQLVVMAVPHSHGTAEVPFTAEQAEVWGERLLMLARAAKEARRGT